MATLLYNTIHIFGFGTVQAISKDKNVQVDRGLVSTTLDPIVTSIWSKRPADYAGTPDYHAINIFNGLFADWQPKIKGEKGFRVKFDELDATAIDALATSVYANEPTKP